MEYWTVYSFFLVAELFLDLFVSWFPFYYEGKILFMLWLMWGGGSRAVFRQFLKPTLALHEGKIDEQVERFKKNASGKVRGSPLYRAIVQRFAYWRGQLWGAPATSTRR